jgi:hypothetical protein
MLIEVSVLTVLPGAGLVVVTVGAAKTAAAQVKQANRKKRKVVRE